MFILLILNLKKRKYGTATIEVHKDSINMNEKVLIIDDLIATGGTAEAAAKLIEMSKKEKLLRSFS